MAWRTFGLCISLALYSTLISARATPRGYLEPRTPLIAGPDPAPVVQPKVQPSGPSPPVPFAGGILTCQAENVTSPDPNFYMDAGEAASAISSFCQSISPGVAFKNDGTPFQYGQADGPYGYPMIMSVDWTPGSRTDCPTLDFNNASAQTTCKQMLLDNIITPCNREQKGYPFWKAGGNFTKDCLLWRMKRVTSLDYQIPAEKEETYSSF